MYHAKKIFVNLYDQCWQNQHIIYFMSLLKVSLCINRPKQRLLCMDTRRGCRRKRSPTPWKNKKIFFSLYGGSVCSFFHGEGFMLRFSSDEGFFSSYGGLFATFSLRGGLFCYVFLLVWGLFHNVRAFFAIIFSIWEDFFVFMEDFMSLWVFYGLAPSPYNLFCGGMLLCNFYPMFSAITYSGHCVPNKAHCNTRVQFTITRK